MKTGYNLEARKRPVNLTLNEDLVLRAKGVTDNLSGIGETLLADCGIAFPLSLLFNLLYFLITAVG